MVLQTRVRLLDLSADMFKCTVELGAFDFVHYSNSSEPEAGCELSGSIEPLQFQVYPSVISSSGEARSVASAEVLNRIVCAACRYKRASCK